MVLIEHLFIFFQRTLISWVSFSSSLSELEASETFSDLRIPPPGPPSAHCSFMFTFWLNNASLTNLHKEKAAMGIWSGPLSCRFVNLSSPLPNQEYLVPLPRPWNEKPGTDLFKHFHKFVGCSWLNSGAIFFQEFHQLVRKNTHGTSSTHFQFTPIPYFSVELNLPAIPWGDPSTTFFLSLSWWELHL